MTDVFAPGEFATFVKQGGKAVTLDKYESTPISINREDQLPEEVKKIMGY